MIASPKCSGVTVASSNPCPSSRTVRRAPAGPLRSSITHASSRTGMAAHVLQGLLGDAEQRDADLLRQLAAPSHLTWMVRRDPPSVAAASCSSSVVSDASGERVRTHLHEQVRISASAPRARRSTSSTFSRASSVVGRQRRRIGLGLEARREQRLRDGVVQVARQPRALGRRRCLADLVAEARVLDGQRDLAAERRRQAHIEVRERALLPVGQRKHAVGLVTHEQRHGEERAAGLASRDRTGRRSASARTIGSPAAADRQRTAASAITRSRPPPPARSCCGS